METAITCHVCLKESCYHGNNNQQLHVTSVSKRIVTMEIITESCDNQCHFQINCPIFSVG